MYCSSCGSAVPTNLAYCNRCGAKTSGNQTDNLIKPSLMFPESLVWAVVGVFIGGIGVIIGLMAVMKNVVGFDAKFILAATAVCFGLLVLLEAVLVFMLLNVHRDALKLNSLGRTKEVQTKELDEAQLRALPEPVASVTEHTTRTFEPVYIEQKQK